MFVGFTPSPVAQPHPSAGLNVDFESVFGNKSTNVIIDSGGFDELGGPLKPTVASQNQSLPAAKLPPNKLVSDDLDSSLANLVGNLGIGNGTTKNDVNWSQPGEKKLTGGSNWQPKVSTNNCLECCNDGTPCNGLSCYYTNRHDRIWNSASNGKCTCNDTTNLNIQPACHETTKSLWPCIRSTDTVYVTRWKRVELFQKRQVLKQQILPAKCKLLSLNSLLPLECYSNT
uniref:Uncharacterized protein n=1 Tax=Ixodes ricinus TaxID=34613 RepID=A0A0K8R7V7_IXORI